MSFNQISGKIHQQKQSFKINFKNNSRRNIVLHQQNCKQPSFNDTLKDSFIQDQSSTKNNSRFSFPSLKRQSLSKAQKLNPLKSGKKNKFFTQVDLYENQQKEELLSPVIQNKKSIKLFKKQVSNPWQQRIKRQQQSIILNYLNSKVDNRPNNKKKKKKRIKIIKSVQKVKQSQQFVLLPSPTAKRYKRQMTQFQRVKPQKRNLRQVLTRRRSLNQTESRQILIMKRQDETFRKQNKIINELKERINIIQKQQDTSSKLIKLQSSQHQIKLKNRMRQNIQLVKKKKFSLELSPNQDSLLQIRNRIIQDSDRTYKIQSIINKQDIQVKANETIKQKTKFYNKLYDQDIKDQIVNKEVIQIKNDNVKKQSQQKQKQKQELNNHNEENIYQKIQLNQKKQLSNITIRNNDQIEIIKKQYKTNQQNKNKNIQQIEYKQKQEFKDQLLNKIQTISNNQQQQQQQLSNNKIIILTNNKQSPTILFNIQTNYSNLLNQSIQYYSIPYQLQQLYQQKKYIQIQNHLINQQHSQQHHINTVQKSSSIINQPNIKPKHPSRIPNKSFLNIKTYYAQIKSTKYHSKSLSKIHNSTIKLIQKYLPSKQLLLAFIQSYIPQNNNIHIQTLMNKKNFKVIFQENKQLYFGQIISNNKSGLGITIKHNYIYEGQYKDGYKIQGIQINQIGKYIKANLKIIKNKEKDNSLGKITNIIMDNGLMVKNMVKEYGHLLMVIPTLVNGFKEKYKDKEFIHLLMVIFNLLIGQQYEGSFHQYLKQGHGKQILPNGDIYQGYFVQGTPHGKGTYRWKSGEVYQGQFVKGLRQNFGILKDLCGNVYKGNFINQQTIGSCEIIFETQDYYKGQIQKSKFNGKGILQLYNQQQIWDGQWVSDNFIEEVT